MAATARYMLLLLCVTLYSMLMPILSLGASGSLQEWYPKTLTFSPSNVFKVYPIDFGPWLQVSAFALFENSVHIFAAFIYLLKYEQEFEVFKVSNYIYMAVYIVLLRPLTLLCCVDKMALGASALAILFFVQSYSFVISLQRRKRMDNENVTESAKFWFDRCVLDAHATWYVWYAHSVAFWGTIAVVYKDGPADQAVNLRGWFSVEDAGTICITFFATAVIAWIVADLFLFHYYTQHVKELYPFLIMVTIGVVGRSVSITGEGLNRNNGIYLALGILSTVAWMKRGPLPHANREKAAKTD